MSSDAMGGSEVQYVQLDRGSKKPLVESSCRGSSRARFARRLRVAGILFLVLVVSACVVLPNYIVPERIKNVKVQIISGIMRITAHRHDVLGAAAHIFAHKSLLQFSLVRYTAYIQPFTADVYMHLPSDLSRDDLQAKVSENWIKLGEMSISKVVLDSTQHFNETMGGHFVITAPFDHLAIATKLFLSKRSVTCSMAATVGVFAMAWGIIPVYLPRVKWHYKLVVPALNHLASQDISLSHLTHCEGYPGYLKAGAVARVYNPSPFSIHLETPLNMRVDYTLHKQDHTVGLINFHHLEADPGWNSIMGNFSVVQTDNSKEALEDIFSRFVADQDDNPSSDKRIYITVRGAGEDTSRSELVRRAWSNLSLRVGFLPPREDYVEGLSADLIFVGSLVSFHPEFYRATLNIQIQSPLPQDFSLVHVAAKAFRGNIHGDMIYNVQRELDPNDYFVPAFANRHYMTFQLGFDEVHLGYSFEEVAYLCNAGITRHTHMGLNATVVAGIGPGGFRQTVRYKRKQVVALMCYHVATPPWKCGEHMQIWAETPGDASSARNQSVQPQLLTPPTSRNL